MRPHPPQCCSNAHHVFVLSLLLSSTLPALHARHSPPHLPFYLPLLSFSPLFPDGHINRGCVSYPPKRQYPSSSPHFPCSSSLHFPFFLFETFKLTLSSLLLLYFSASSCTTAKWQPLNSIFPSFSLQNVFSLLTDCHTPPPFALHLQLHSIWKTMRSSFSLQIYHKPK